MSTYAVYILMCADGSYYTRMTNNLRQRIRNHQEGLNKT
jgi:putative endonuclease